MNPDHLPRPFDPPHSEGDPLTMAVPLGDYGETDLIKALNVVCLSFETSGLDGMALERATHWLAQKFRMSL